MNKVNCTHWRLRQPRYRLTGSLCLACGHPVFPSRPLCPSCAELHSVELIVAWSHDMPALLLPVASRSYVDWKTQG